MDKAARLGIRAGELLHKDELLQGLRTALEQKNPILTKVYGVPPLSLEEVYHQCIQYGEELASFICETEPLIKGALKGGELVLLEGAQGTLLDIDFGTYPYVTSSSSVAAGAFVGLGLSPSEWRVECNLGVVKAYTTRVGGGPMPTEIHGEVGELIRQKGHEYGATTGRPRRCGWFDVVAARFSAYISGFNALALTRLDVLDTLDSIKLCTSYKVNGKSTDQFPSSSMVLERCQPVYEELPGWQCRTNDVRHLDDLPPAARSYVKRLEEVVACPIDIVSVGPRREQTIMVRPLL